MTSGHSSSWLEDFAIYESIDGDDLDHFVSFGNIRPFPPPAGRSSYEPEQCSDPHESEIVDPLGRSDEKPESEQASGTKHASKESRKE